MKIIRKKKHEEALLVQLIEEKEKNANLAGYGHLPKAPKEKVVNVPNSSDYKEPNNNTCIGYWEDISGCELRDNLTYYCPSCQKPMSKKDSTLDGAHVYKSSNNKEWYFVPLCSKCNNPENTDVMEVDTVLVPVPSECYEKKSEK